VRSCGTSLSAAAGRKITTIEGVGATPVGKKVQQAWAELDVPQCGYCQSGQIVAATALLTSNPKPTDADINAAMEGNICRCGTYPRIRAAIHKAAGTKGA
jgi:isoquinoline 1-oxidoreductase alpha subunit